MARTEVAVGKGGEAVLGQDPGVIASAPSVAKEQPINWDVPVMSSSVLSVERS